MVASSKPASFLTPLKEWKVINPQEAIFFAMKLKVITEKSSSGISRSMSNVVIEVREEEPKTISFFL